MREIKLKKRGKKTSMNDEHFGENLEQDTIDAVTQV